MNPIVSIEGLVSMDAFTGEDLRVAGYIRHSPDATRRSGETGLLALWQKRVMDEVGTRYFINVREWDWSQFNTASQKHSFDAAVQFHRDGRYFNVDYIGNSDDSIIVIELMFDELWEKMDFAHVDSDHGKWNRHSEIDGTLLVVKQ